MSSWGNARRERGNGGKKKWEILRETRIRLRGVQVEMNLT